jgi:transposase
MGQPDMAITPEQRAEVERQLQRTDLRRRVRERLEMVTAAALGAEGERSARWSGRAVETVDYWLTRFATGGVAALSDAPRAGRPVRADAAADVAALAAALAAALETPPRTLALAFAVWTSQRLSAYLEQQTGVHICAGWLRVLLGQRGGGCGRPKHPLKHLQDPAAVAAARAQVAAVGEKGARGAGALRAALPGRDAPADHSRPVPGLASPGPASDTSRRGHHSARHGVWQRRGARPPPD